MVPIVGEGVLYGAERSVMEQQMKMAQGPLTGKQLRANAAVMAAEAQAYLDALGERGELDLLGHDGRADRVDRQPLPGRAGVPGPADRELRDLYHDMEDGIQLAGLVNPRLPLPPFRRRDRARAQVVEVIHDIIGERRRRGAQPEPPDMLSTLMSARYTDGSALTDDVIAGLLVSVVFAGHHTSAAHGTWTGVLLLAHPRWYQRARAEQDLVRRADPERRRRTCTA